MKFTNPIIYFIYFILKIKIHYDDCTDNLSDVIQFSKENHYGPVVIFPEVVTSNGNSILKFQRIFDEKLSRIISKNKLKVHIISLSFKFKKFSPCFTIDNDGWDFFFHFLFGALYQVYNYMVVNIVDGMEDKSDTIQSLNSGDEDEGWSPAVARDTLIYFIGKG
jgi:hypothetical protein